MFLSIGRPSQHRVCEATLRVPSTGTYIYRRIDRRKLKFGTKSLDPRHRLQMDSPNYSVSKHTKYAIEKSPFSRYHLRSRVARRSASRLQQLPPLQQARLSETV